MKKMKKCPKKSNNRLNLSSIVKPNLWNREKRVCKEEMMKVQKDLSRSFREDNRF